MYISKSVHLLFGLLPPACVTYGLNKAFRVRSDPLHSNNWAPGTDGAAPERINSMELGVRSCFCWVEGILTGPTSKRNSLTEHGVHNVDYRTMENKHVLRLESSNDNMYAVGPYGLYCYRFICFVHTLFFNYLYNDLPVPSSTLNSMLLMSWIKS